MKFSVVIVGPLETNCYLVYCPETRECIVIDPGADPEKIFAEIGAKKLRPVIMLNTHGHVDHIGANKEIKDKYNIPLLIHAADQVLLKESHRVELAFFLGAKESPPVDAFLEEGQEIKAGNFSLRVLHTPGHSLGSVVFLGDGVLFSGDTLFNGGVGRTDLPGGNWEYLENSIKTKILTLPDDILVLPGHGPQTTVGKEKDDNPFIQ